MAAQAHGSGSEQSTLLTMIRRTDGVRGAQTLITADAGYHSEDNLRQRHEARIPALIADGLMRRRDERFKAQDQYKTLPDPLYDKRTPERPPTRRFTPADFTYDAATNRCICPAGKPC